MFPCSSLGAGSNLWSQDFTVFLYSFSQNQQGVRGEETQPLSVAVLQQCRSQKVKAVGDDFTLPFSVRRQSLENLGTSEGGLGRQQGHVGDIVQQHHVRYEVLDVQDYA